MIEAVLQHWDDVLKIAGAVITIATVVTRLTPTPRDDEWLRRFLARFSFLDHKDSGQVFSLPLAKASSKEDADSKPRRS